MLVAFSASFFNCPAVAQILSNCDEIYSTNDYAVATFPHKSIHFLNSNEIQEKAKEIGETAEFITFSDLLLVFHKWVQMEATDAELEQWHGYFGQHSADECRKKSQNMNKLNRYGEQLIYLEHIRKPKVQVFDMKLICHSSNSGSN